MFVGLKSFQKTAGLKADGVMRPDGATEKTIRRQLSADRKKGGSYIWHTKGDGKVRSAHAERDGKVFSWGTPPEGGHPGEAPNCRCWAEEKSCLKESLELRSAQKETFPLLSQLRELEGKIEEVQIIIEINKADIEFYNAVNNTTNKVGLLSLIPHPLGRFVGFVAQIGEKISEGVLWDIESDLAENKAKFRKLEKNLAPLQRKIQNNRIKKEIAEKAYDDCKGSKG